jgi:hypothetical protein
MLETPSKYPSEYVDHFPILGHELQCKAAAPPFPLFFTSPISAEIWHPIIYAMPHQRGNLSSLPFPALFLKPPLKLFLLFLRRKEPKHTEVLKCSCSGSVKSYRRRLLWIFSTVLLLSGAQLHLPTPPPFWLPGMQCIRSAAIFCFVL